MTERIKSFCYFILDLFTLRRGITVTINGNALRLPTRYFKYFPKNYEQTNFAFFREKFKPGINIIDIGAHIGLYSVYMQQLSRGKVFSFEPTPITFKLLKKTIHINHMDGKITPIAAAVADKKGRASFNIDPAPASVGNSLVTYGRSRKLNTCEVEVTTIDDFVKEHHLSIGFIKIDAEGVELGVLKGAADTIKSQRPIMILGLHPAAIAARHETNEMIWEFLKNMNYAVFYEGKEISKDEFCKNSELFDVHLVPAEQAN